MQMAVILNPLTGAMPARQHGFCIIHYMTLLAYHGPYLAIALS